MRLSAVVEDEAYDHHERAGAGPEPPLLVDRLLRRRSHRFGFLFLLAHELLALAALLFFLELLDQLGDGILLRRLGIELEELLEAEDRLIEIAEVAIALADVEQEP